MDALALAWPRRVPTLPTADVLLAGLVAALSLLDVWAPLPFVAREGHQPLLSIVFLGCSAALLWRRRAPLAVLAFVFTSGSLLYLAVGAPEALGTFLPPLAAIYAVGRYSELRSLVLAAPVVLLGTAVHEIEDPRFTLSGPAIFFWALLAAAWPVGRAFRLREQAVETLSQQADELRRSREADARAALLAERARIARELHDVVGHGLSVVVLQLVAALGMLESGDQPAARHRLLTTERSARQALAEMRRLLGLLDEEAASLEPQPGLGELGKLVEETRAAGVEVEFEVSGEPVELPAGLELAAYRVVQEALTNVIKHARPPRARVRLAYGAGDVAVEIDDEGEAPLEPPEAGRGIAGMRERVGLYGGELTIGPRARGGFGVRARFPAVES